MEYRFTCTCHNWVIIQTLYLTRCYRPSWVLHVLITDDLQHEVAKNDFVSSMFMRGSHHRNCSCIFIVQNLYFQGKNARDIALNAHNYVIFRNPGVQLQIQNFARRRGQYQMIMNAYKDYCSQKHSFIIIDNSQHTDDCIKIGMPVTDLIEESYIQC